MSEFANLLLPLDASATAAGAVETALWLADALGASLHVLHATAHPLPAADALARLRADRGARAHVVIHQPAGDPQATVLAAVEQHHVDLVVMSARGASLDAEGDLARPLGGVARSVLERSRVPVLLLPGRYRPNLPWRTMLAAISGEPAADEALDVAARLTAALGLCLTVLHVDTGQAEGDLASMGAYADSPHHEVPKRFEQLVGRGLARCTTEQVRCVDDVLLRSGDAATIVMEEAGRRGSSVVALGWHGAFGPGRASVLTHLLHTAECALLVVRQPRRAPGAQLRVGSALDGPLESPP